MLDPEPRASPSANANRPWRWLKRRWPWILVPAFAVALIIALVRYLDYRKNLTAARDARSYLRAHQLSTVVSVRRCRRSADPQGSIDDWYWCEVSSRRSFLLDREAGVAIPKGPSIVCFAAPDADRLFGSPKFGAYPVEVVRERNCFPY